MAELVTIKSLSIRKYLVLRYMRLYIYIYSVYNCVSYTLTHARHIIWYLNSTTTCFSLLIFAFFFLPCFIKVLFYCYVLLTVVVTTHHPFDRSTRTMSLFSYYTLFPSSHSSFSSSFSPTFPSSLTSLVLPL